MATSWQTNRDKHRDDERVSEVHEIHVGENAFSVTSCLHGVTGANLKVKKT